MKTSTRLFIIVCVVAMSACGSDGLTGNGGIYEIQSWTDNPDNCVAEGPSVLENQSVAFFYIKDENFLGTHFVTYQDCATFEECEADFNDDETIHISGVVFEEGNDDDGLRGTSGFLGGDTCDGIITEALMTFDENGNARLEKQEKAVDNVPKDSDDFCDFDAATEQAKSKPCQALEVITGTPL